MVFQVLVLRWQLADEGSACQNQIGTKVIKCFINDEILLFPTQSDTYFCHCFVEHLHAEGLRNPNGDYTLASGRFNAEDIATLRIPPIAGYNISGPMLTAMPDADFELQDYAIRPAKIGRIVEDGDVIDLGNRVFKVLHLPGHSPGGIGLWEENTKTLFSGDAIYDGPLLDNLHHSNIAHYIKTMERLRKLPVNIVHAGHEPSFGRERLREIADCYLSQWELREKSQN